MWSLTKRRTRATVGASVHCVIGDFPVTLRSDLPDVLDDFTALYPTRSNDTREPDPTIRIEVLRAGRSRFGQRLYQVFADGEEIGSLRPSNGVFPLIEWGINLRIMETRNKYLQFHAASLSHQGRGFIFAGDSGCGKSTLAAMLIARGWRYFCDEFAIVDVDALRLRPFPKALCIKAGAYPLVHKLGLRFARRRDYVKAFKGRVGYVNPHAAGPDTIAEPACIRAVVFPRYCADVKPQLRKIQRTRAALRLFRQCFNRDRFPDSALPIIIKLVSHAECFELDVGDDATSQGVASEETCRLLESCLNTVPLSVTETEVAIEAGASSSDNSRPAKTHPVLPTLNPQRTRRDILKVGVKLAYVAPVVLTLSAHQAFAAASNPSGICSTAKQTGQLCETDTDCCSRQCDLGVCK